MKYADKPRETWRRGNSYNGSDAEKYTRLPFAALMGLVLFGEFPDHWVWLGGTVIFVATIYMAHRETSDLRAGAGQ